MRALDPEVLHVVSPAPKKLVVDAVVAKKAGSITEVRGLGTSLFIDTPREGDQAYKLQQHLLKEGVLTKLNGSKGISIKPALILEQKHVDQFTAALSRF